MSNSDYSQLLTKMSELKSLTGEYTKLTSTYRPAMSVTPGGELTNGNTDTYTLRNDINAMSSTATPLVIRPGDDYKDYWKYVGEVKTGTSNNLAPKSQECWNMAARDPRLFKAVVYTGNSALSSNPGQSEWNNRCYGLMWDAAGSDASYNTKSTGYSTMVGNAVGTNGIYTKLGIKNANSANESANITEASKLRDIELRVNSLVQEIASVSGTGINKELNELVGTATDSKTLIDKINQYMNTSVSDISGNYYLTDKRKEMNNVYSEINNQTTLRARKYRFIFYILIAIGIIVGYAYLTQESLVDQIDKVKNVVLPFSWWANWWVITIVVLVFIVSSFGWDMKGNIMMVTRYVTDPDFWTGRLWWVGVTFLLLIIIFLHATFKSFFVEFDEGMKGIQEGLDGK